MTDMWNHADPDAVPEFEDLPLQPPAAVPDGHHVLMLADSHAGVGEESGKAFIVLTFHDVSRDVKWKNLMSFSGKTPEKAQAAANRHKKYVRDMGIAVDTLSFDEVGKALAEKHGEYFDTTVKTNGEFRNTYMNGPSHGSSTPPPSSDVTPASSGFAEPAPADVAPTDDDGIPF